MTLVLGMIIITMTVATYRKLVTSNLVDSAAQLVGSQLLRARQLALAKRRHTALLMPGPNSTIKDKNRYSSLRVAYINHDSGVYTFDGWPRTGQWLFTRGTCRIMEADADIGIKDTGNPEKNPKDDNFTQVDDVDLTGLGGGAQVDDVRAIVFRPSGRVRGDTRFITIGESVFVAGKWRIINPDNQSTNVSSANQITLEVNRFTGGVRYRKPENY